ncbi:hypothetical protein JYT72_01375 [Crocinitomix catalasitica]|nr:hypothetical protein [Crocinitomix catalasitica]
MIGQDFDKIPFELFGWELLEPMALITDGTMGIISIVLAFMVNRIDSVHPLFMYWKWFFVIFGLAGITGALGHAFFNYWGVAGKFPSWILAPISVYLLEQGMISVYPNPKKIQMLKNISFWKYILVVGIFIAVCLSVDLPTNEKGPFLPLALNTAFSMIAIGVFLSYYYSKKLDQHYRYFIYGTLMAVPALLFLLFKINLHPWFNKEDAGHVLIIISIIFFYIGVKKVSLNFKEKHNELP